MFADNFNVVSIHCVARELGASFLCKCPASRGGSLRSTVFLYELTVYHARAMLHVVAFVSCDQME